MDFDPFELECKCRLERGASVPTAGPACGWELCCAWTVLVASEYLAYIMASVDWVMMSRRL